MIIIPEFKDLTGKVFGVWTVVERAPNRVTSSGNTFTVWKCVCNCGTKRDVVANSLLSGRSTSCGCATKTSRAECAKRTFLEHGESKSRLYRIWAGMKKRCTNKNSMNYYLYGGRGITVCDEWQEYIPFRDWSMCNGYTDELTIDRIDTNKGYSPEKL